MTRNDANERIKHFLEFVIPISAADSNNTTTEELTLKQQQDLREKIKCRMDHIEEVGKTMLDAQKEILAQIDATRRQRAIAKAAANAQQKSITRNLYEKFAKQRRHSNAAQQQRMLRPTYLRNLAASQSSRTNSRWIKN